MAICCLSLSHFQLPVLTPPVNIHAPVVMAALMRPFPKTCLSFGWSSKFCRPPWTEIRSLGSSSCHSLVIRCRRRSGFVSKDTRTYWKKNSHQLGRQARARWWYFSLVIATVDVVTWRKCLIWTQIFEKGANGLLDQKNLHYTRGVTILKDFLEIVNCYKLSNYFIFPKCSTSTTFPRKLHL